MTIQPPDYLKTFYSSTPSGVARAVLDVLGDGVVVVDVAGRICYCNRALVSMFGYDDTHEILGRHVEVLLPVQVREQHIKHRTLFAIQPSSRPMAPGRTLHGLKKSGDPIQVEVRLSDAIDIERAVYIVAVVRDVEQFKIVETQQHTLP